MINVCSVAVLLGLLHHIHIQGNGIVMTVKKIWSIEPYKESDLDDESESVMSKDSYIESVIKYII
jgi:hypothetical protein